MSTFRTAPGAQALNLDRPGHYLHWGFVQLSLTNLIVIVVMVILFALALVLPFPKDRDRS